MIAGGSTDENDYDNFIPPVNSPRLTPSQKHDEDSSSDEEEEYNRFTSMSYAACHGVAGKRKSEIEALFGGGGGTKQKVHQYSVSHTRGDFDHVKNFNCYLLKEIISYI